MIVRKTIKKSHELNSLFADSRVYIYKRLVILQFEKMLKNVIIMKDIEANTQLIAACGLYCGACRKYLADKCPGCHLNEKATWCKIRSCVNRHGYHSCAECATDVTQCKTYSNLIGKIFAFIFRSDRPACIRYIKDHGEQAFAEEMTRRKSQTMKKNS